MKEDSLLLQNQLCFPVYAASRLIIREYQPYLDELEITYPQYIALMVLWEKDGLTVNEMGERLILNTNTVTPLLKRMEKQELIERKRSKKDERRVIISLTTKGRDLQERALKIPEALSRRIMEGPFDREELNALKSSLDKLNGYLSGRNSPKE
ncbi:MAG: MarR family transcriptional regulator [Spirochaetales bacterium]|nr:MarR family transcriptional regulator [Spirochaetales bacterium]